MVGVELWVIVMLLGCGGTPMDQQIPVNRGRGYTRAIDTLGLESTVWVSAEKAWDVLPAAYAELGLGINFREPAAQRLGACYHKATARLGKEPISTYLDCGETRGAPNADRYEVAITALTTVRTRPDGKAALFTFLLGVGADGANSTNRRWCYSRGALEERIRTAVETRGAA
jgi:hypothetical protein